MQAADHIEDDPRGGTDEDSEDDDDDDDSEGWEEFEDDSDGEAARTTCLFCQQTFPNCWDMFEHCAQLHGSCLEVVVREISGNADCYHYIKLINFIRKTKPSGEEFAEQARQQMPPWHGDEFLKPHSQDDPALCYDIGSVLELRNRLVANDSDGRSRSGVASECPDLLSDGAHHLPPGQSDAVQTVAAACNATSAALESAELQEHNDEKIKFLKFLEQKGLTEDDCQLQFPRTLADKGDNDYFASYDGYQIHAEMLQDKVRTGSYQQAILKNAHLFRGKTVLDLGCGTGILSIFCVRAGASRVYAVDESDIIYNAMDIARENGVKNDSICFVKGRIEELADKIPAKQIDVIVCEWMGYMLLFESMLESVRFARDTFLKPDVGAVLPDIFHLYVVGVEDTDYRSKHVDLWDDCYGLRMPSMRVRSLRDPRTYAVSPACVITRPQLLLKVDAITWTPDESGYYFRGDKRPLVVTRSGQMTAVTGYFDVGFHAGCHDRVEFSTSPDSPPTHWLQTHFLLHRPLAVTAGETVNFEFSCRRSETHPRQLLFQLKLPEDSKTCLYIME